MTDSVAQVHNVANMKTLKNAQHEKFAQARAAGMSETAAAIKAGYSKKTAPQQASRLLTNVNISNRVVELLTTAADKTIMGVRERMVILTEIGRGALTDYQVTLPDGCTVIGYDCESPNPRAVLELTERIETRGEGDGKQDARIKKIRLHNPIQAIQELNKMDGSYAPTRGEVELNHNSAFVDEIREGLKNGEAGAIADISKALRLVTDGTKPGNHGADVESGQVADGSTSRTA